jgi:hypothetical protein
MQIQAIEEPMEAVTVVPVKKYYDENGIELQPVVQTTKAKDTASTDVTQPVL